jgi:hypothetical protein
VVLGIDPGQTGALVALSGATVRLAAVMPATPKVGVDLGAVRDLLEELRPDHVVLERAQAMPGQGSVSTAGYMRDYGGILGLLCALRIPHETVHPSTWHAQLVGKRAGDPKARALEVVRQRLPALALVPPRCRVPHAGLVDAACIALWGQQRGRNP